MWVQNSAPPLWEPVLVSGQDQIAGVDAGPGFGNAAIVYLDLVRSACEDDAGGGARPAGDAQPLGLGGVAGAHGDWHLRRDVPVIADLDGNQPSGG